jgi:hypothetical protein
MKMKFILGLFSMLLVSMTLAFHTASAKTVLVNEMDGANPFKTGKNVNDGSIKGGLFQHTAGSSASSDLYWDNAFKYDNTRDYEISVRYNTSSPKAADLDLGLLRITKSDSNTESWAHKGVYIKDDTSWKRVGTVDPNGDFIWKLVYKADKTYSLYQNNTLVVENQPITKLPQSATFTFNSMAFNGTSTIDYVRISDNIPDAPVAPANLTATAQNNTPVLTWSAAATATSYTVSRSVYANGPFEDIAQNIKDVNYTDASAKAGNTYYYVVKASNESGTSPASNTASVTLEAPRSSLDVIIAPESTTVGETFTADIALKNVQDIYAEDFSLSYDPTLVEYVGYEAVTGYKVYNETKDTPGALRFIIASQGKSYVINSDTTIVKLKFKAIAAGSAKIDALKARVADTTKEYDLETANVLEDTILIEKPRFLDVDRSGQYTLLDLSLDAFYFGLSADDTNKDLYDADQTEDNKVGDDDLTYIVDQILKNKEYTPNK